MHAIVNGLHRFGVCTQTTRTCSGTAQSSRYPRSPEWSCPCTWHTHRRTAVPRNTRRTSSCTAHSSGCRRPGNRSLPLDLQKRPACLFVVTLEQNTNYNHCTLNVPSPSTKYKPISTYTKTKGCSNITVFLTDSWAAGGRLDEGKHNQHSQHDGELRRNHVAVVDWWRICAGTYITIISGWLECARRAVRPNIWQFPY